jgi:hypothetical protein
MSVILRRCGQVFPWVPDYITAVEDDGVASISTPEAVMACPIKAAAVDHGPNRLNHTILIIRVKSIPPPVDVGRDFCREITEHSLYSIAPPDDVCVEVPVPNRVIGGQRDGFKALLADPKRLLGQPSIPKISAQNEIQQDACGNDEVQALERLHGERIAGRAYHAANYPI